MGPKSSEEIPEQARRPAETVQLRPLRFTGLPAKRVLISFTW